METNYELKNKRILVPPKALWMVLAMVLFGLFSFAQQGMTVKVANDQQLRGALENPSVESIVFESSVNIPYSLDYLAGQGVMRAKDPNGSRSGDCVYWIQEADTCFFDPENPPSGPDGWVFNIARAGSIDWQACGCCPGDDDGAWIWNTVSGPGGYTLPPPPGGNLQFIDPLPEDTINFKVFHPGVYTLKYSWGAPWNSYVQTEYKFFSEYYIENLYADSVCDLCTDVDLTVSAYYGHPDAELYYKLINECTTDTIAITGPSLDTLWYFDPQYPYPITNDTMQIETFEVCAPYFGTWKLVVSILGGECADVTDTIYIEFSLEPVADAGPDVEVCDDLCTTLVGGFSIPDECQQAANFSTTWVQLEGPGTLTFDPADAETTYVCRTDDCSYGQYEIEFQVVNGECYDSDTMLLTFYEQPIAEAGDDQHLCDQLCFTLVAEPYPYCSDPIALERYGYWTYYNPVKGPGTVTIDDDESDTTGVCIDLPNDCPWGVYTFIWTEVNGTCEDTDTVNIYLYEQPVADAGTDSISTCFIDGCFTVYGAAYQYCSDTVGVREHEWFVEGPAGVTAYASEIDDYVFEICPEGDCIWGEYTVVLFESNNGICEDYDTIHFYLFEPPTAVAGDDFEVECYAECFSLGATPYSYCSDPAPEWGERYGEWTKISGPAEVSYDDPNLPTATACLDTASTCPWGVYTFVWTEYNGDCEDADTVVATIYEPPVADAGEDYEECVDAEFSMDLWFTFDATAHVYCQEEGLDAYSFWSKCGGPGYVTWYENDNNPNAWVHVSCFGCYCFVYHEVNGTCESTDTVHICFYEHPYLPYEDMVDSTCVEAFPFCYDLGELGIDPYVYGDCENYNNQGWVMTAGAGEPTYIPDNTYADAEVCVDEYGCYTFEFIQWNGMEDCADTVKANLFLFEQPDADAGADAEICGNCYMLSAIPYSFVVNECAPAEDATHFWMYFSYIAPDPYCDTYTPYWPCYTITDIYDPAAEICLCNDDYYGMNYGTYGFIWTEINGTCQDQDTVWITFDKIPDELPITGCTYEAMCGMYGPGGPVNRETGGECGCIDCWFPEDTVMTVCAYTVAQFCIDWECLYGPDSEIGYGPIPGYTYEWSFTGPAGSYFNADPFYYDCECGWQGSPCVTIYFGECCDTARLYLTITSPEGCVTTEEWKFFVQHPPDATISGPEIAEVGNIFYYSIPEPENPCYLYVWSVQHCGVIVSGQGTGTIGIEWTDYNANGGWGLVSVEVHDTCTCCCNIDELYVRVLPANSLGNGTLEGHVYYNNSVSTPLNGVKITLWNAGVPIFETYSFNDIDGGNGVGYYAFDGIHETNPFGITAEHTAMWYGANATDALGVELQTITPTWTNPVQIEAADVNNSGAMNATDALWIKQRAIAMVTQFPAGDWAFAPNMSSIAGTYDVYTLNYGDVNKSNIPSSNKEMPAITLVNDGVINVTPGELFDLPIRVADAVSLGAITLNLGYNSALLEVVEVNAVEGALTNANSSNIAMAWSNISPMVLNNNDAIVTLRLKALGEITSSDVLFSIETGTEFADPNANVLEDVTLKSFGISTDPVATEYFLSYNRPNPFSTTTQIEYTLPESGKVRLSVVDLLGQEIAVLVNQTQSAGSYTVQYSAAGMAPGVYIYKITVEGESRDFVDTRRMVISQ
jgi:hypothetical protein